MGIKNRQKWRFFSSAVPDVCKRLYHAPSAPGAPHRPIAFQRTNSDLHPSPQSRDTPKNPLGKRALFSPPARKTTSSFKAGAKYYVIKNRRFSKIFSPPPHNFDVITTLSKFSFFLRRRRKFFFACGGLPLSYTVFLKERLSLSAVGRNFSKKDYLLAPQAKIFQRKTTS